MADATTDQVEGGGGAGLTIAGVNLNALARGAAKGEIALGLGVMTLIIMLIVPLPSFLLDMMLAISITGSVLVLMTALLIQKPLEFSSFPSVLLLTTMLRLALNMASTRLILSEGDQGPSAAGAIIETFGSFVMQGNYVIGVIVFIILVIVNFVVITKGSGRIAEVAARFTLDAMPGKQMAIDADLSAGIITEEEARTRRKELEGESSFFGAMDGASKFVKGDAMAGIMITIINIIGGMVIGVAQKGISFGEAAQAYTTLTIGDGLVSQIPALIISVAAGMLVSKAGVDGSANEALGKQLMGSPQGLSMVSGVALMAGLLPGMPILPFTLLSAGAGYGAWRAWKQKQDADTAMEMQDALDSSPDDAAPTEAPISDSLIVENLKIELGFGLLPLINETEGRKLTDQIKAVRRQIATDFGFVAPQVRILDNVEMQSEDYRILVKETEAGVGRLRPFLALAMDASGTAAPIQGEKVKEPVFGLPAIWVENDLKEEAAMRGYTVVDAATVLTTHFTEIIKDNMADLLTYGALKEMLDDLPDAQRALVGDIVPAQITMSGVQRVLQNLLREKVSVRDLSTILEAIAEASGGSSDLVQITEHVRARLARQLCNANLAPDGQLSVITLSPQWEQSFAEALIGEGGERQLAMEPTKLQAFVGELSAAFERAAQSGETPVLLTSAFVRPYVRSLVERFRAATVVMSQAEIHPRARLRGAGSI